MTRVRLIAALAVSAIAATALATAGISLSAPTAERASPSCLGARATIVGTARGDVLRGTAKRDVIAALGGADRVYGRGGDDLLCGGRGDDLLDGGPGQQPRRRRRRPRHVRPRRRGGPGARTRRLQLPAVEGLTLDGEKIALADYRGRKLFVNVWAAW